MILEGSPNWVLIGWTWEAPANTFSCSTYVAKRLEDESSKILVCLSLFCNSDFRGKIHMPFATRSWGIFHIDIRSIFWEAIRTPQETSPDKSCSQDLRWLAGVSPSTVRFMSIINTKLPLNQIFRIVLTLVARLACTACLGLNCCQKKLVWLIIW